MKVPRCIGSRFALGAALLLCATAALAEDLLMARSRQAFPEAMATLQQAITAHGYTVSRVQHVDAGLTTFGFETDLYRVVFYGEAQEIARLVHEHPQLAPYLPLPVAIFAENGETLVVAANPAQLSKLFHEPQLDGVFRHWERDLRDILTDVRAAE